MHCLWRAVDHEGEALESFVTKTRDKAAALLRFRQMKTLQKFSAVHAAFQNHFNQDRHLISRDNYNSRRSAALAEWKALTA